MYFKITVHTIWNAGKTPNWCFPCCQKESFDNKRTAMMLNPLIRVFEQCFTLKPFSSLLTSFQNTRPLVVLLSLDGCFVVVVSFSWRRGLWSNPLRAIRCRLAFSRSCASWVVSSSHRLCSRLFLYGGVRWRRSFVSQQVLVGFVHGDSKDEVGARTREILVFTSSFRS